MIGSIISIVPGVIVLYCISSVLGHGMLMEPVNRGSAWRKGFNTPINYNDNGNYCGGYYTQHVLNGGRCGVCGDNYFAKRPRPNENGGFYGTGQIVQTYIAGQEFDADVLITSNHKGYFEFALCPLDKLNDIETEACFEKYPIRTIDGEHRYVLKKLYNGYYRIRLILPENVTCNQCSLRWTYVAGNNWGVCPNGKGALGCGTQETFRTCSDIRIINLESLLNNDY